MRGVCLVLAVIGGCALAAAAALALAAGDPAGAGWVLVGPGPFYVVGLIWVLRRPGQRVAAWLLACGTAFLLDVCLGDGVLPLVHGWSFAWVIALIRAWASDGSTVAGVGLIGLFPTGVPQRAAERWVLRVVAAVAVALPVLFLVSNPSAPSGDFPDAAEWVVTSPLFVPALRPAGPVVAGLYYTFAAWSVLGVIMLYLRYRRSSADGRRRIRWLLAGALGAVVCAAAIYAAALSLPAGWFAFVSIVVLWALLLVFVLGPVIAGSSEDGLLGIDQSARRSLVYRTLWVLIAVAYVAGAAALGLLASHYLPAGPAVLLAVGAAVLFQPAQRALERLADRWVFGARLDGYEVLTRFGAMLETSPGPADLLPRLAAAVCDGLGLTWARVRLDLPAAMPGADEAHGGMPAAGAAGIEPGDPAEPALAVPLMHAGSVLGRIECGERRDGPLLDEDRRLLANLAGQAAAAARNLYLTAELSDRLDVIRRQASELTASRARVAQTQDAERQRIQRDLHDGMQQDVVVLTAKLALARERLRRGDPRADEPLAELQRDLGDLLVHLREFAHAIHPPVLADQGLLEAIEAQAARLPLEVVIEADPALRGVRYPQPIETATWFVVSEALTNAVKHARAGRVLVALAQPNGSLAVEVRDDGCGFDSAAARGLGLASLADRISIVHGDLRIDSGPGRGTTLRAEIPLTTADAGDG
jgi:signal transduction histidine kinase